MGWVHLVSMDELLTYVQLRERDASGNALMLLLLLLLLFLLSFFLLFLFLLLLLLSTDSTKADSVQPQRRVDRLPFKC